MSVIQYWETDVALHITWMHWEHDQFFIQTFTDGRKQDLQSISHWDIDANMVSPKHIIRIKIT